MNFFFKNNSQPKNKLNDTHLNKIPEKQENANLLHKKIKNNKTCTQEINSEDHDDLTNNHRLQAYSGDPIENTHLQPNNNNNSTHSKTNLNDIELVHKSVKTTTSQHPLNKFENSVRSSNINSINFDQQLKLNSNNFSGTHSEIQQQQKPTEEKVKCVNSIDIQFPQNSKNCKILDDKNISKNVLNLQEIKNLNNVTCSEFNLKNLESNTDLGHSNFEKFRQLAYLQELNQQQQQQKDLKKDIQKNSKNVYFNDVSYDSDQVLRSDAYHQCKNDQNNKILKNLGENRVKNVKNIFNLDDESKINNIGYDIDFDNKNNRKKLEENNIAEENKIKNKSLLIQNLFKIRGQVKENDLSEDANDGKNLIPENKNNIGSIKYIPHPISISSKSVVDIQQPDFQSLPANELEQFLISTNYQNICMQLGDLDTHPENKHKQNRYHNNTCSLGNLTQSNLHCNSASRSKNSNNNLNEINDAQNQVGLTRNQYESSSQFSLPPLFGAFF